MGMRDLTLYDIVCRNALFYPDRPAWYEAEEDRTRTFGEMRREVDLCASALRAAGCTRGDRIGIVGKNSLDYFVLLAAAAALGGIVVPINWRLSAAEAAFNLNDGKPRWVFAESDDPAWWSAVQSRLPPETRVFNLRRGQGRLPDLPLADAAPDNLFAPAAIGPEDGYVIIHTAAVAGRPRGALLSHANMLCANLQLMDGLRPEPESVVLNALPLFHVAGLCTAWLAFHLGALTVNLPKFDAVRAVEMIARKKVSLLMEFAPMLGALLDEQARTGADIRCLRRVAGLDGKETIERYQRITGGTYFVLYGQTETSLTVTMGAFDDCPGSAGRLLPLAKVALLDEADQPVPNGATGEIAVQGPIVFKGYWELPEDTARTFRGGWHHTGDLGRIDEQGCLWYAGRKPEKELIKPGGENVYPAEVEKVILEHPDVEAVVVFGVPDPKWKEGIKAVCVLKERRELTAETLIRFVGERIARYKKPHHVQFVEKLPLTPNGEVDRSAVKKMFGAG